MTYLSISLCVRFHDPSPTRVEIIYLLLSHFLCGYLINMCCFYSSISVLDGAYFNCFKPTSSSTSPSISIDSLTLLLRVLDSLLIIITSHVSTDPNHNFKTYNKQPRRKKKISTLQTQTGEETYLYTGLSRRMVGLYTNSGGRLSRDYEVHELIFIYFTVFYLC